MLEQLLVQELVEVPVRVVLQEQLRRPHQVKKIQQLVEAVAEILEVLIQYPTH